MSDTLREAIEAAERYATGQGDLDRRYIERLRADPGPLEAAHDEDRAYLALLLDFAGLREEAVWVLRDVPGLSPGRVNPMLRNTEGMLAAGHGEYGKAKHLFEAALAAAADAPASLRTAILANLAAVSFQTGEVDAAKELAAPDHPAAIGASPAAAMLAASVQAAVAATEDDRQGLDAAAARLENASRSWTADLSNHDMAALALVAEMAITDSQLASSSGSVAGLERAAAVLEVAALRLAAELGGGHPQALAATARLAQIEVDIALAAGSPAELEQAIAQFAGVCERADSKLGATSPLARQLAASLASAERAQFRAQGSRYVSRPSVRQAELGQLTFLSEGASGRTFRVPEFRLPGDPATLAYEEFTGNRTARARSAWEAVAFRAALSPDERTELDRYCAWPRAAVEDASGVECGVLMHIPQEFFSWEEEPGSGRLRALPRELEWLSAPAAQPGAERPDYEEPDHTDRLFLLAQLVYAIGWLHKRGWVFGDLNLKNALFTLDPPRLLLISSTAAPLTDPARQQSSAPHWDPPECPISPPSSQRPGLAPQDTVTDTYKLGLAILRCLTPGRGAESARNVSRLAGQLDQEGVDLIGRALSADRNERPTAKQMYKYLCRVLTPRMSVPEVTSARLVTPTAFYGQDIQIEWRISKAETVTVSASDSRFLEVEPAAYPGGYTFQPEGPGPVSIEARNRFGTVTVDLGTLALFEPPPFTTGLTSLPAPQIPAAWPGAPGSVTAPQLPGRDFTPDPDPRGSSREGGR